MKDKPKYNPKIHHRRSIRLKGYDYAQAGLYFITICCQNRQFLFGKIIDGQMILNDAGIMIEKWYYELENKFHDIKCHEMVVMPNHFHCIVENVGADLRVGPVAPCPPVDMGQRVDMGGECVGGECIGGERVAGECIGGERVGGECVGGECIGGERVGGECIGGEHVGGERVGGECIGGECVGGEHVGGERVGGECVGGECIGGERVGGECIGGERVGGEHVGSPLGRVVQWFKTMTTNEYIRGVKTLDWHPFHGKLWQRNYFEHIIRDEKSYQTISKYIVNNPVNGKGINFIDNEIQLLFFDLNHLLS